MAIFTGLQYKGIKPIRNTIYVNIDILNYGNKTNVNPLPAEWNNSP